MLIFGRGNSAKTKFSYLWWSHPNFYELLKFGREFILVIFSPKFHQYTIFICNNLWSARKKLKTIFITKSQFVLLVFFLQMCAVCQWSSHQGVECCQRKLCSHPGRTPCPCHRSRNSSQQSVPGIGTCFSDNKEFAPVIIIVCWSDEIPSYWPQCCFSVEMPSYQRRDSHDPLIYMMSVKQYMILLL